MNGKISASAFLSILLSTCAFAQQNELGFLAGGTFSPDSSTSAGYQGVYARRIVDFHAASLYLELPVLGVTDRETPEKFPEHFSSVFFTPSLKLKFLPGAPITPFLSVGGGFAHFDASFDTTAPSPTGSGLIAVPVNTSRTTGAFQAGAGLDIKTPVPMLGLRVEAREFRAGDPDPGFTSEPRHHNVFVGAGIVLRF
jgi:opacity protein-like surface antigen